MGKNADNRPKTEAQYKCLDVLKDIGGWSTAEQLSRHGANHAAAMALVKTGLVEQRTFVTATGYKKPEWRISHHG